MKPRLSFWQIWNMSFGFLGVQYAFGLQQANMSPIYRYLGADEAKIPILWLAGPVTGLILQPIIGAMSDRTWNAKLGRRRPYFLVGAILTSLALILMPYSSALWMAVSLMWLLDGAANVTMEPFRAFIADKLPEEQIPKGFALQSFFVGFGQSLANLMPFIFPLIGISLSEVSGEAIPAFVWYSFLVGAFAILFTVGWTIITTSEYPPEHLEEFRRKNDMSFSASIKAVIVELIAAFNDMPLVMRELWWVKFFTWYGLPLMWQYLALSIARHCFGAVDAHSPGFDKGIQWGNLGLAVFSVICFLASLGLPTLAKHLSNRGTHALCLTIGGLGFISMLLTTNVYLVMLCMCAVGVSWASIMAMPYVILADAVPPERVGVYMGIFNMFIVIPQIINMITVPLYYETLLGGDPRQALAVAGICFFCAAASCFLVKNKQAV